MREDCEITNKITTAYDFTVQKKHLFSRNVYSHVDLKKSENISTLKNYYLAFNYFLHIVVLLNRYYNKNSYIEDLDHDVMATILDKTLNLKHNSFLELYHDIEDTIKPTGLGKKKNHQNKNINKIIGFVYTNII